ncbi:MAG: exodeoxyribonuclease V subunit gamma [Desulfatibacillaceae bacterium]
MAEQGMLHVHSGNRAGDLCGEMARIMSETPLDPFAPEIVLVQEPGMTRWVSLALAAGLGVCANVRFELPNAFLNKLFASVLDDVPGARHSPYGADAMGFRIAGMLPEYLGEPGFAALRAYLADDDTGRRRFMLARRIAAVFDRYLLFRPEMILEWEKGAESHWQAVLWRDLAKLHGPVHRPALRKRFAGEIGGVDASRLPERVFVFGVSAMPRFHLAILWHLAKRVPVHLFHVNHCEGYWADVVPDPVRERVSDRTGMDAGELHLEAGNSLLASMGRVGRDFFRMICDMPLEPDRVFTPPREDTLLGGVQADIFHLREPGAEGRPVIPAAPGDRSLSIHACHGPLREMEVLYSVILDVLNDNPDIEPRDICVACPDISAYAPYVDAVFGSPPEDRLRIPYTVAGRGLREQSEVADAFFALLEVCRSRFPADSIPDLLRRRPLRERIGLPESFLDRVRQWVEDTRVRWGIDGAHRAAEDLPGYEDNTWRVAIERLLLGYAMEPRGLDMFGGVLPYDGLGDQDGEYLGVFVEFAQALFAMSDMLDRRRTPEQWSAFLVQAAEKFLGAESSHDTGVEDLYEAFGDLVRAQSEWGFTEACHFDVVGAWLEARIGKGASTSGYLRSGVTFCSLSAVRNVPFKVMCLAGMSDGAFPGRDAAPEFDLMAADPRPGDRSRRLDDRFLFLEAVLAAREKLVITYVGRDNQDNQAIAPSALVAELLDYVRRGFATEKGTVGDHVFVEHRLHAHHPDYFDPGNETLFAYCEHTREAAAALAAPRADPAPFLPARLPRPELPPDSLDVWTLARFLANPARELLRSRLGVRLDRKDESLPDVEEFTVAGLDKYNMLLELVDHGLAGVSFARQLEAQRACGRLPHGTAGDLEFARVAGRAATVAREVRAWLGEEARPGHVAVAGRFGEVNLAGDLGPLGPNGLLLYRPAEWKATDLLRAWCAHLLLQLSGEDPSLLHTRFVAVDQTVHFPPLAGDQATAHLEYLCGLYVRGMCQLLPLAAQTSHAYARELARHRDHDKAVIQAGRVWEGASGYHRGDGDDPYLARCFPDGILHRGEFADLATSVFGPPIETMGGEK